MVHLRRREEGAYLLALPRGCTEIALKLLRNLSVQSAKSFCYSNLHGSGAALPEEHLEKP